jgi:2-hydroxychromene-2-carboxylate isomerase
MSRKPPRVYFSFRSPFSWMALRRLHERLPDAPAVLDFIPFWDPDEQTSRDLEAAGARFHYVQMSKAKHLYILQDTKRLTRRFGYRMAWPIDVDPWWEVPHLAWLKARRDGDEHTLYRALAEARWERGQDICDREVLAAAAGSAGLDGDALAAAADEPDVRREGTEALVRAWHDDVFGIPFFIAGRHKFWGLDRLEDFLDELLPAPEAVLAGPPLDTDTAGGCG